MAHMIVQHFLHYHLPVKLAELRMLLCPRGGLSKRSSSLFYQNVVRLISSKENTTPADPIQSVSPMKSADPITSALEAS
ncbi:unnamed protein product [Prunus armeniaca]|uniref:Uncharacterized protein n=1 Tax=Prunus armeniaca TaxID=36596 RepID=A0A6J5TDX9_PRUAR|nr:unnamed protein product [Prunus armeniaca]